METWSFTPFPPLPPTLFPNTAFYTATSPGHQTYQITISYPFEWGTSAPALITDKTALTLYVLDGNALGQTASEAVKRRVPVDATTPDTVVVSIGYPLTDAVYNLTQRAIDFRPPGSAADAPPSGADAFLAFIDGALRPWVRGTAFPGVAFARDALYGHSLGGLSVVYALVKEPELFDTFLVASPGLDLGLLDEVSRKFGIAEAQGAVVVANGTGPAVSISYGSLEQYPIRRKAESEAAFRVRQGVYAQYDMPVRSHELFHRLKWSGRVRDVVIKEYVGQDHFAVAASAITDGMDYFFNW
ncbi:Alpha/Beta hydrolase protein [Lasiosphaeris hirsuta]|uniref:Alpha/Beta hydrolase protein n=1 Tax=Lasiosphaeris hirsuta TaxID=260670 RepID=A0AA40DPA5_9PEZI|nr:Alpha/Beta hydrolase protein [Lasiosphaeris hirsuta]